MKDKNSIWYQHEGLDRTHTMLVMLQELLGYTDSEYPSEDDKVHPAIWNDRCKKHLSEATVALAGLYQAIGEWEEDSQ